MIGVMTMMTSLTMCDPYPLCMYGRHNANMVSSGKHEKQEVHLVAVALDI